MRFKKFKKHFLTAHLYISLFFIPMAIFYKITGGIAIFQYFGNQSAQVIQLSEDFSHFDFSEAPSTEEERQRAKEQILLFLISKHIPLPSSTNIRDRWDNKAFVFGSVAHYIELDKRHPTQLTIYTRDLFANLIQLHFGRAGTLFNVLALGFVLFLFITYLTGLLLCNYSKHRTKYTLTIFCGFCVMCACMIVGVYF